MRTRSFALKIAEPIPSPVCSFPMRNSWSLSKVLAVATTVTVTTTNPVTCQKRKRVMKRSLLAFLVLSMVCFMQVACESTSTNTTRTAAGLSPQEVKISIGDFYVRSPVTTFTTGTQYQFVVTNVGTHHHDFLIMHPMETMT